MIVDIKYLNNKYNIETDSNIVTKELIIKKDALLDFDYYMNKHGYNENIIAVYDSNTYYAKNMKHVNATEFMLDANNLHANEIGVSSLMNELEKIEKKEVLVAIGSGTIHDLCRYCSFKLRIPFVSCPTGAS